MSELKVALIGSAPASVRLAPYHDPEWSIWGCSPGTYGVMPRCNAFFELHLWEPGQPWFSPEYVQWLTALPSRGVTLWVGNQGAADRVPGASVLPHEEITAEFDPSRWFCTSSLFWMMATAIRAGAKKIGLWGVDMAATEEYEMQRAGIHFLAYVAKSRGIEVGAPPESDLFTPRFRYGVDEWTHAFRKLRARREELQLRRNMAAQEQQNKLQEVAFLNGALDDLKYAHDTWAEKGEYTGPTGAPVWAAPA
jgi:hypothetical protein